MSKTNPSVAVTLDKERHIRLDLNAMAVFEEATGKSLLAGKIDITSAVELRALLYACLKADDPALTLEAVGALITVDNMKDIAEALALAVKDALPEEAKDKSPLA